IKKSVNCDHGIAVQSILLGATEKGLGGCIIASIDRKGLKKALGIADSFEILLVLALGKSKEEVVIEEIEEGEDIEYWRDSNEVHHVPKRRLDDIIIG
ncbi:nitroreductase family protein, partial [candidate division WOR-3 bacterium]|nr:nitroreductase family protein [candidate division WOR-3 bacterium]